MSPAKSSPERQLASFLEKFTPEIASLTRALLAKMRTAYPTALELVYDNYNALAIGFSPTEKASHAIFSIAVYPRWVSLFFLQAKGLRDPHKLLQGSGSVAKHIRLASASALEDAAVRDLMMQAVERATVPFAQDGAHAVVIKSISAKQRPRRPA